MSRELIMIKKIFGLLFVFQFLFYPSAWSQEVSIHSQTAIPNDSRFELIQSTLAAKHTFLIDKFNGECSVIRNDPELGLFWVKILKRPHSLDIIINKNKVNYQLFTSGLAAKHTFLINVDTGASWRLVQDDDLMLWSPFQ